MALTTTLVGTSSTLVIGANPNRRKLTFHNPNLVGQQSVYFSQGTASVGAGLALLPGEKYDVFGDQALTSWNAIGSGGGANASVIEFVYGGGALPQGYAYVLPVG